MREMKFRAFWKEWDSMYFFDIYNVPMLPDEAVVMQYTDLKDRNGKETFSDDIVSDGINPPFVVDLWNWPLMVRLAEIEFEVIGNIYENPELIEK